MLGIIGVVFMFVGAMYEYNPRRSGEKGFYIFLVGLFMLLFNLK